MDQENSNLDKTEKTLKLALNHHNTWRAECLNMIASESFLWDENAGSSKYIDLSRRAVLGVPGTRYSEGSKYIDEIETITNDLIKRAFNSKFSEWRPTSASLADGILLHALTSVNDNLLATPSPLGHPTWHENGYAGFRGLRITDIPYEWETLEIDYEKLGALIDEERFSLIVEGSSLVLFPPDFRRLRNVAKDRPVWYDGAHVMGLILGGEFPNPVEYGIDALSGSTQKTLAGPLGGIIVTNRQDISDAVKQRTSNDMATPDYSRYVSLSFVLLNWKKKGRDFAKKIVGNAKSLAEELNDMGMKLLLEERGFTSTHQIGLLAPTGMKAADASRLLAESNIISTPFPIPTSNGGTREVIRMGVTELTQMGAVEADMHKAAKAIVQSFRDGDEARKIVREVVLELQGRTPI